MGSTPMRQTGRVAAGCIALLASWVAVAAPGEGAGRPAAKKPPRAGSAMAAGTAGLHVTVYETKLPADRIAAVNGADLLAKADTPAGLQAALGKLGRTRILYHAYQLTALAGESRIQLGSRRPFVSSTRMTPGRSQMRAIQYQEVGMILKLTVEPSSDERKGELLAHMELELSALADSDVEAASGVKIPEIRQVQVDKVAGMRVGRATVAVQIDGSARAKDAPATAYVLRVLLQATP